MESTFLSYYHLRLFLFITKLLDTVVNLRFSLFHFSLFNPRQSGCHPTKTVRRKLTSDRLTSQVTGEPFCSQFTLSLCSLETTPSSIRTLCLPSAPEPFHTPSFLPALLVASSVTFKGCSCRNQGSSWILPFLPHPVCNYSHTIYL